MSHRTKLLITALFLVLLSVPAAYVALTWRPADPLRIRVIADHGEVREGSVPLHVYEVEIRNTNLVAIHCDFAAVYEVDSAGNLNPDAIGLVDRDGDPARSSGQFEAFTVPRDSISYGQLLVREDETPRFLRGKHVVQYSWVSAVRERGVRLWNAVYGRLKFIGPKHEDIVDLDRTLVPLQMLPEVP